MKNKTPTEIKKEIAEKGWAIARMIQHSASISRTSYRKTQKKIWSANKKVFSSDEKDVITTYGKTLADLLNSINKYEGK